MNSTDTERWLQYHSRLHIDFGGWLRSLTPDEMQDFVSATEGCLRLVTYADAKQISQKMFSGEIAKPFAFSDHPRIIRERGEPVCSAGGSSQRTIGEIEELRKKAAAEPLPPGMGKLLRELYVSIGLMPRERRALQCGPQSCSSSRVGKCPYCEGEAIIINGVGHCCDCLCRFDPDNNGPLPANDAHVAKVSGISKREKKKSKKRKRP